MVWAAVWVDERGRGRRSPLVIMDRDTNAPKSGYSSKSYIKAFTKGLPPNWCNFHQYMHDNAAIHTSLKVREFLTDHHIQPLISPPYSPDLTPIEHLWWCLKKCMYRDYLQYNNYSTLQEGMEWVLQGAAQVLTCHHYSSICAVILAPVLTR
jgi:hypothetical protein